MTIIEICKKNALIYSNEICKTKEGNIFPAYVDWADHIATENTIDYEYHLNKTVADLEKLLKIFKTIFPGFDFSDWEEDWYEVSISSAWIHDIGMIVDRENHGLKSAELIIKNNDPQFNFDGIDFIDRIMIGILCIKHHKDWYYVVREISKLINDSISEDSIENQISEINSIFDKSGKPKYFINKDTRLWPLEFSAKLLSTSDSLRYRGPGLRNNLGHPFYLCSQCESCKNLFEYQASASKCKECNLPLNTKALFYHPIRVDLNDDCKFSMYEKNDDGSYHKITNEIKHIENIRFLVLDENQQYTCGDLLLSQVKIMDYNSWFDELRQAHINLDDIDEIFGILHFQ